MALDVILRVFGPVYEREIGRVHRLVTAIEGLDGVAPEALARTQVVVTSGTVGFTAAEMDRLPGLRLICTIGTGYENVDIEAAQARGVKVTHAAGANSPAVAEMAIGLLLAVVRAVPQNHASVVAGDWRGGITPRPMITGKRLGIFGMGDIGGRVARLAEAFDMTVSYASRSRKPELPWTFHDSLIGLARAVDFLVVTAPGGKATRHVVDAAVLEALGPEGYLVNVGRGSVVDADAVVAALGAGTIAGAALDVYEGEPVVPEALRAAPNAVLTPHVAGVSSDVQIISARRILDNIRALEEGAPLATPIPEMA